MTEHTQTTPSRTALLWRWLAVIAWAGGIFLLSSRPQEDLPELGVWTMLITTAGHFVVFAVLMLLLQRALRYGGALSLRVAFWVGLALVAVYALSDEYHQSFVPGRQPDPLDWLADVGGAVVAGLLYRRAVSPPPARRGPRGAS